MKTLLVVICASLTALISTPLRADQGVMFQYLLTETSSPDDITTSDFGFLVHFDKAASADMGGVAKLDMQASDQGNNTEVALSLYDYSADGQLIAIGDKTVNAPFRQTTTVTWEQANGTEYTLSVTPTRHTF